MPKTKIIPCTKEEMDKLIEASIGNDYYYMLFNVAKYSGRRLGELWGNQKKEIVEKIKVGKGTAIGEDGKEIPIIKFKKKYKRVPNAFDGGIKVKDIDFDKCIMKVWVLKRREVMQDESVLPREVINIIRHYVVRNKLQPEDYLFRGKNHTYRAIQFAIISFGKKAGINHKVSFHNFRHYLVTELLRKGMKKEEIQKITGHKKMQSLEPYDHLIASDFKDKIQDNLKGI